MNDLYTYNARCTSVYDGDSITVDIDLGFNHWMLNQKIRLFGINTPEVRGAERPSGLIARDRLERANRGQGHHTGKPQRSCWQVWSLARHHLY